ncbi:MAG: hypothetical protein JWP67_824 [Mucilaginibacter sp.]|nr:hypothetical protein [Mucilaginibacter sp.]
MKTLKYLLDKASDYSNLNRRKRLIHLRYMLLIKQKTGSIMNKPDR